MSIHDDFEDVVCLGIGKRRTAYRQVRVRALTIVPEPRFGTVANAIETL